MTVNNTIIESVLGMKWEFQKDIIIYNIQNQHTVLQQQDKISFKVTNHSYCKSNLWPVRFNIPIHSKSEDTYEKIMHL